ncbi:hypothetical protein GCM10009555_075480 [Acrocarpospora macrocephala]|uniref:MFS transporter n=1 Tax=Acrocarpospora macrocephala TaxID=150177 RepID=A0A5M3X340_9ACTN|nr:hypothetical protein [Acrocarpospora macrocephala]GES14509.1 hypothetical protein Amac_081060 [Acrocarpospora macrocephala]
MIAVPAVERSHQAGPAAALAVAAAFSAFPSPFYRDYAALLGGGAWPTALLFSVHGATVAGVMGLVGTGRLAGLIARAAPRRVLAAAMVVDAAAGLLYLVSPDLAVLVTARIGTGVALGVVAPVATSALTAHPRGASIATACLLGGVGAGACCAGLAASLGNRNAAFGAGIALLVTTALMVGRNRAPLSRPSEGGRQARDPGTTPLAACVVAFAANGVLGLFTSVLPGEVAAAAGRDGDPLITGAVVALVLLSAAACRLPARPVGALPTGALLVVGAGGLAAGWAAGVLWLALLGGALLGAAAGLGYAAAVRAASTGRNGAARLTALARVQFGGQLGLVLPVLIYASVR